MGDFPTVEELKPALQYALKKYTSINWHHVCIEEKSINLEDLPKDRFDESNINDNRWSKLSIGTLNNHYYNELFYSNVGVLEFEEKKYSELKKLVGDINSHYHKENKLKTKGKPSFDKKELENGLVKLSSKSQHHKSKPSWEIETTGSIGDNSCTNITIDLSFYGEKFNVIVESKKSKKCENSNIFTNPKLHITTMGTINGQVLAKTFREIFTALSNQFNADYLQNYDWED